MVQFFDLLEETRMVILLLKKWINKIESTYVN